ncbi:MAG: CRISPR-associated protein Cas4 [Clostridiales bacterium]|nr:CRISPR-associated protein Cas4 [Clostridiales bacterium]
MEKRITGTMIYYYFVCKKKLWYFCHDITMETENDDVLLGKLLDETSYKRQEKHINIDNVINIDFIKTRKELHEVKKSKSIEEASIWQVKYYLYYLKKRGVEGLKAKMDYPLLKENRGIELTKEDEKVLEEALNEIISIKQRILPPEQENKKICKKCAYYELCFI